MVRQRLIPAIAEALMDPQARERVTKLIAEFGGAAFQTPRVLEFQVSQALQDLPIEREALVLALKQGHVDQLRRGQGDPAAMVREMAAKGIDENVARWALDTWRSVAHGVRSATLKKGDAYLAYNKTTGMSYRPPTREQFARGGMIVGVLVGVLVGAFWGGVKAISLARPVTKSVATYDGYATYGDDFESEYEYGSPTYQQQRVDLKFTQASMVAWLGWLIAGGLIGAVAGGTSALYLTGGSTKFVGGYSGALVGVIGGLMTGHRLIAIGGYGGSFSDQFAQVLGSVLVGALSGAVLGGFRDLFFNLRSGGLPNPIMRALFRMST